MPALGQRTRAAVIVSLTLCVLFAFGLLLLRRYQEPLLRARVRRSVEARTHAPVQLDRVHLSLWGGVHVTGQGLRIYDDSGHVTIGVASFAFSTDFHSLLQPTTTLTRVQVQGMTIDLPAAGHATAPQAAPRDAADHFVVTQVIATDSRLIIANADPTRPPMIFDLGRIVFDDPGADKPFHFDALLLNPKPIGNVHAAGTMGPWNAASPRQTPVTGTFDFEQSDLSSIAGVSGHMRGRGQLAGTLGLLQVQGSSQTQGFGIAPGPASFQLESTFHAVVDGQTGEVTLNPVTAHLLHTSFTGTGSITRVTAGHDVQLDTQLQGRAEDLLQVVAERTRAPLLRAGLTDRAHLHIPPGRQRMLLRMELTGTATLDAVRWTDPETQSKLDDLSARARGHADQVKDRPDSVPTAPSTMHNDFQLRHGLLRMNSLSYRLPGAQAIMDGTYDLPADSLDFHGVVRTDATASHMTTGLKSLLLKPLDPLLRKHGAGMQLPVSLTGDGLHPQLGLDLKAAIKNP